MDAQHVPAWKRLGLKLKYANESASNARPSGGVRKERQETSIDGTESRLLKKRRIDGETAGKQLNEEAQDIIHESSETSRPRRKKSVTFTPDTKVEDGDSAQTIQFWVPDSLGSTPKTNDTSGINEGEEPVRKAKKGKKSKTPKSPTETPPRKATTSLNYLNQFHFHRSAWKFNKNHEIWILKHALSKDQIPVEQSLQLASYLQGLKSLGARQRLTEQSRQALELEEAIGENDDELRGKLQEALGGDSIHNDADSELPAWLNATSRAKLILLCLGESLKPPPRQVSTNGQIKPRAKRNKSRTTQIEVNSSSSSESEDEDSDSDSSSSESNHEGRKTEVTSTKLTSPSTPSSDFSSDSDESTSEAASDTSSEGSSDSE